MTARNAPGRVTPDRAPRRRTRRVATTALEALALVVVLPGCALVGLGGETRSSDGRATVTDIVDGDTIVVAIDGREEQVRLLGVDTPETVHPSLPVECFGPEASARLAELAPVGATLRLERDEELRDLYGRLLAYLYAEDGRFVNEQLVAEGYGEAMSIPPNTALTGEIAAAEAEARAAGRGLWSACGEDLPVPSVP